MTWGTQLYDTQRAVGRADARDSDFDPCLGKNNFIPATTAYQAPTVVDTFERF